MDGRMNQRLSCRRAGITLAELLASVAITTVLVGGMGAFTIKIFREMGAAQTRDQVAQWSANALEQARAPEATKDLARYAASLVLPERLTIRMVDPKLVAVVLPQPGSPGLQRIDLEIRWKNSDGAPARPLRLSTLLAAASGKGGQS